METTNKPTTGIPTTANFENGVLMLDPNEILTKTLLEFNWFLIVKAGLIIILFLYLLMSIVVIRQIYMMISTVISRSSKLMLLVGYLNLIIVILILLFAIFL